MNEHLSKNTKPIQEKLTKSHEPSLSASTFVNLPVFQEAHRRETARLDKRPDRDAAQSQECLDRESDDASNLTWDEERSELFESGI